MVIAILRIVTPIIMLLVIARIIWPRYQKSKRDRADRIEVEAEVVSSEPHTPSDIPQSSYTTKPSDAPGAPDASTTASSSTGPTRPPNTKEL